MGCSGNSRHRVGHAKVQRQVQEPFAYEMTETRTGSESENGWTQLESIVRIRYRYRLVDVLLYVPVTAQRAAAWSS